MKRIFLLAAAGLMFAACSNDSKEEATPATIESHSREEVISTSPLARDTTKVMTKPSLNETAPTASIKSMKTESKATSIATEVKTKSKVENAAGNMGYAPTVSDSNLYLVNKAEQEAFFRKKIHENNSIDGGGQ